MRTLIVLVALLAGGVLAAVGLIYSGAYGVAADDPHWPVTDAIIEAVRDRSIASRARGIEVPPDLGSPERVRRGAGNYDAMCTACHLKPGVDDSEVRAGLYPQPPRLASPGAAVDPARGFWIIKHGLKMTGMPAWSRSGVEDATIWDMVALLQKLPGLSPEDYAALVEASPGHTHAGAAHSDGHAAPMDHHDAPGTPPHHHGGQTAPPAPTQPEETGHDHAH